MGKLAFLLVPTAFFAVFLGGQKIFGAAGDFHSRNWDSLQGNGSARTTRSPKHTKLSARKEASHRHEQPTGSASRAPTVRRRANDMALARRAVLHLSDTTANFHRIRIPGGDRCRETLPDLSHMTVTGRAHSDYAADISLILSTVQLFANARQAAAYFEATNNRKVRRCVRRFVTRSLTGARHVDVVYSRVHHRPQLGDRTAVYLLGFRITGTSGGHETYPVELLNVQVGRAVVSLFYAFIFSPDGSRPCGCELRDAAKVISRLQAGGIG